MTDTVDIKLDTAAFRDFSRRSERNTEVGGLLCWNGDPKSPITVVGVRDGFDDRIEFYPDDDIFACYDRGMIPVGTVHTHGTKNRVLTVGEKNPFFRQRDESTIFSRMDMALLLDPDLDTLFELVSCVVAKKNALCMSVKDRTESDRAVDFLTDMWENVNRAARKELGKADGGQRVRIGDSIFWADMWENIESRPQVYYIRNSNENGEITWGISTDTVEERFEKGVQDILDRHFLSNNFGYRRVRAPRVRIRTADVCRMLHRYREVGVAVENAAREMTVADGEVGFTIDSHIVTPSQLTETVVTDARKITAAVENALRNFKKRCD